MFFSEPFVETGRMKDVATLQWTNCVKVLKRLYTYNTKSDQNELYMYETMIHTMQ